MISVGVFDTYYVPSPSEYIQYRDRKEWQNFAGSRGEVFSVTTTYEAPAGFEHLAPYDLMMVKFPDGTLKTCMGAYGEHFKIGDEVECFVGRFSPEDERGIIVYRIKARHPVVPQQ